MISTTPVSEGMLAKQELFMSKVAPDQNSGCWLWRGSIWGRGYGYFWTGAKSIRAHRYSYEMFNGPIPAGLTIDHLCRVRSCVNPKHLEPVTMKVNVLRGIAPPAKNSQKTHCKRGHEFTSENTGRVRGRTFRYCIACRVIKDRTFKAKKREARALLARVRGET